MSIEANLIEPANPTRRYAFTLVEMLVAMAVTLLMMAALARSFGFVGQQVRDSRANLQLSGENRDVSTRLSSDLNRCTVSLEPNNGGPDQNGYFVYYEGPVTDATSSIFRVTDTGSDLELSDSRYGDFDDYLAFTAVAPTGTWFTGKVPRYLLEMKSHEVAGTTYTPGAGDPDPFDPVVIRSKHAEIIYFASPEYNLDKNVDSAHAAYLRYIDVDGDTDLGSGTAIENGLPDRLRIHRRVLLIRPDLNLVTGELPTRSDGTVTFMQTDAHPTNWATAMAPAHQQCDLSLRRVLNTSGVPTRSVAANSLADLAQPHNRFAHVRIPHGDLSAGFGAGDDTSMPVLALGAPPTILDMGNDNGDFIAPDDSPVAGSVVTPNQWSGFLRREFILGHDRVHTSPDPIGAWSTGWSSPPPLPSDPPLSNARLGEDLLVNNVLAFDVQIYDPTASWIADPAPPTGSGLVVGPGDAGYRETLNESTAIPAIRVYTGGFVDLAYPVLAGGELRGWSARSQDRRSSSASDSVSIAANAGFLISDFSGIIATTGSAKTTYQQTLFQSGRLVVNAAGNIVLFQPTFDTFTSHYESDGLLQDHRITAPTYDGTIWTTTTAGADIGADGLDTDGLNGVDDLNERETTPPLLSQPEAIRVTIRLENPSTRQIRQMSVVHRDDR